MSNREVLDLARASGAADLEILIRQKLDALYRQCTSTHDKVIVLNAKRAVEEAAEIWRTQYGPR